MKKLIRILLVFVAINVVANVAARLIRAKRAEWEGLTESQVRDKVEAQLPGRMPAEKREAMADKVVAGLRSAGMVAEDEAAAAETEEPTETDTAE